MSLHTGHVHKPVAIGHAITCEGCLAPIVSWGVTAPMFGKPGQLTFAGATRPCKQKPSLWTRTLPTPIKRVSECREHIAYRWQQVQRARAKRLGVAEVTEIAQGQIERAVAA